MALTMNHVPSGGSGSLGMAATGPFQCLSCWNRQHFASPEGSSMAIASGSNGIVHASRSRLRNPARCHNERIDLNEQEQSDKILSMKTVSAKRFEAHLNTEKGTSDWKSWEAYFPKVEEEANLIMALKFQLDEAVKSENFQDATKLNAALNAAKSNDVILQVANELQRALEEERYSDAAKLRDVAGAGLVGWWSGLSLKGDDPFGRIIKINAAHGRLVAEGYSARQLAMAAPGNPLFEVYVRKDQENKYRTQAVYLHRDVGSQEKLLDRLENIDVDEDLVEKAEKLAEEVKENVKNEKGDASEETIKTKKGINDIVNFLKNRIPQLGMKVIRVVVPEGSDPDIPKIIEEIIEKEQSDQDETSVVIESESSDIPEVQKDGSVAVRVVLGGSSSTNTEDNSNTPIVRLPATIDHKSKDSFVLRLSDTTLVAARKDGAPALKIAKVTPVTAGQMPDDVAKILSNVEKLPVQASKDLKEIIKLAVGQAQSTRTFPEATLFRRIDVSDSGDPFQGLYVGSFGANALEVIQLSRKYGHWDAQNAHSEGEKLKFYEYVEAVKLTGDMNVPAGKVSFRAKIGREHRLSPHGVYPDELGVIGRYKGEGKLAEPGYKSPKWTEGELVILDGRKNGPTSGASLGFVFCLPEHHFLILFDRLSLEI